MSLLQMSFSGTILILAIVIIRTVLINKLPKKILLFLWGIALLRLLIPFSISSIFSVYTLINQDSPIGKTIIGTPITNLIPVSPLEQMVAVDETIGLSQYNSGVSVWLILWCIGFSVSIVFFIISYLRCRKEFQTSLPVKDNFSVEWLKKHQIRRNISIRQSSRISAPLTYGIFHPVILMPQKTDWGNKQQLQYVFSHEYVHICHFDTAIKLIIILTLCIHWFNPMVWVLYILFNQDIELACDEGVVCQFGESSKADYARTLISMEEEKSRLYPFCNNFSKNSIEERIKAIMKYKKTTIGAIFLGIILIVSISIIFTTSAQTKNSNIKTLAGYIVIEGDAMHFDEVEIVFREDTERINELQLKEEEDYPSGFAIINKDSTETTFELTEETTYSFIDMEMYFVSEEDIMELYTTTDREKFLKHLGKRNSDSLQEQKIPYYVEIKNGKVINITEEFAFTI